MGGWLAHTPCMFGLGRRHGLWRWLGFRRRHGRPHGLRRCHELRRLHGFRWFMNYDDHELRRPHGHPRPHEFWRPHRRFWSRGDCMGSTHRMGSGYPMAAPLRAAGPIKRALHRKPTWPPNEPCIASQLGPHDRRNMCGGDRAVICVHPPTPPRAHAQDANSVMESQRLQIRQIQVMSNHKDVGHTVGMMDVGPLRFVVLGIWRSALPTLRSADPSVVDTCTYCGQQCEKTLQFTRPMAGGSLLDLPAACQEDIQHRARSVAAFPESSRLASVSSTVQFGGNRCSWRRAASLIRHRANQ